MRKKMVALLQIPVVWWMVTYASYFGLKISNHLARSYIGSILSYQCLSFFGLLLIFDLYCHYILQKKKNLYIRQMPDRWLLYGIWAIALPLALIVFYLTMVQGRLYSYHPSAGDVIGAVFATLLYGGLFRTGSYGILYRGFLFSELKKAWGPVGGMVIFNVALFLFQLPHRYLSDWKSYAMVFASVCISQTALCLVIENCRSIWPAVLIDAAFEMLFCNNYLFYINGMRDLTWDGSGIIYEYLIDSSNMLLIGVDDLTRYDIATSLPAMVGYGLLLIFMSIRLWKRGSDHHKGMKEENDECTENFDDRG